MTKLTRLRERINFSRAATNKQRGGAPSRYATVLILLIILFVFLSVTQERFFTTDNLRNLLSSISVLWIISMGMTFVVLTVGIDLSVGSMLALAGVILATLYNSGIPAPVAVLLCVAAGVVLGGGINGILIGKLGLSFFVVTLGTLVGFRGVVNLWSGTKTQYVYSPFIETIGARQFLGVPIPALIMLATFLIAAFVLRYTYFGRDVYAVGGNREAAKLSGVNVSRILVAVYAISAGSAALASVVQVGRLGSASPLVGDGLELQVAAAVLLGGTSFVGGIGGVAGTAVGALFIGTLENGLGIAGVESFWQQIITGIILILAILVDRLQNDPERATRRMRTTTDGAQKKQTPGTLGQEDKDE